MKGPDEKSVDVQVYLEIKVSVRKLFLFYDNIIPYAFCAAFLKWENLFPVASFIICKNNSSIAARPKKNKIFK